jgi:tetratricopeptide (TPR) repeat protein
MKALEVMGDRFGEKELMGKMVQFVALTYTRLSMLFSDMYLHEQAIFFAQQSLIYYKKLNMPIWYIARMLNEIGSQYDMMKNSDSAVCYYQKAINILDDTTTLMYRDIAVHLIFMEYKNSVCQTDSVIKRLRQLLLCSESQKESQVRYMNIGELFYYEQRYDSAWVYLNKVFQMTSVVGQKRQAAEWLLEIGKTKNMEVRAYTDFLAPFANQEENKSEIKSQLTELYKAFRQAQLERQHKMEMQRHHVQSMAVVAGLLMVILIVFALYHNNKRLKRHLENQIIEEKQVHNMEKKALSSRLKKSNEILRGLQNQIKQQNINSSIRSETQAATFGDEPICRLIMDRVHAGQFKAQINCSIYKDYALSKEQLVALQDAANRHFDLFTVRLVQAYPDITKSDLDYCCLHLLGLNDADMSALMQRAYNTINERNSKLRKVLGCKSSISAALKAFANNKISH